MSKTYAAPLSFIGAFRRLKAWAAGSPARMLAFPWILAGWWVAVLAWYLLLYNPVTIWVFAPFRLIRRSQRKSLHVQEQMLDELRRRTV